MANAALTRARSKAADAVAKRQPRRREAPAAEQAAAPRQQATFGDTVTLVNRTTETLHVTFDGVSYPIPPGDNPGFPRAWVVFAKNQNPLMGSEHPFDPHRFTPLVGVRGTKDDCGPLKQSKAPQRIDRSRERAHGKRSKTIRGDAPTAFEATMPSSGESGMFTGRDH